MKQNKKALNEKEAFDIQEKYPDLPHGWVQWKGTDVCMDIHCKCGYHSHIDADFAYFVECPRCLTVYSCNGHIELIEVEQKPDSMVVQGEVDDSDKPQWNNDEPYFDDWREENKELVKK